ncbi:MAG: hypothetical protein AB2421_20675, partial [Thermotaleaceae bacterium]
VDFYQRMKIPQCQYYLLLLTWNKNQDLLKIVDEIQQETERAGVYLELLSASTAYNYSKMQMTPFGERSSIDEGIKQEPKWRQLVNIWSSSMKSNRENRLLKKKQMKDRRKEGGDE